MKTKNGITLIGFNKLKDVRIAEKYSNYNNNMKKTQKEYWEMTLHELVEEWGDNDMSKYDEEQGYAIPESQRQFYLWQALARDMEMIKKNICK